MNLGRSHRDLRKDDTLMFVREAPEDPLQAGMRSSLAVRWMAERRVRRR